MEISAEALSMLLRHDWPGNVRELENVIQRGAALASDSVIEMRNLFLDADAIEGSVSVDSPSAGYPHAPAPPLTAALDLKAGLSVSEMERKLIHITLEQTSGNRTHAADLLGISLRTLRNKLREYREADAAR
jgi:DNA-binding NtrC family response regulator